MGIEHLLHLVAAWLLTYLLHSTLLLLSAAALTSRSRGRERTAEWLWKAALFGGLVTAGIQWAGPFPLAALSHWPGGTGPVANPTGPLRLNPVTDALSFLRTPLTQVFLGIWILGATIGLVRVARGWSALRKLLRDRREISDLRSEFRLPPGVTISVTTSPVSPMAWGRSEICFPAWVFEKMNAEELASVIAHEAAHLHRRDPLWFWAGLVMTRVFWFQPLNRLAFGRLGTLAEFVCDDQACVATGSRLPLASALAKVAARLSAGGPLALAAMASTDSMAVKRVRRILDERRRIVLRPNRAMVSLAAVPLIILALFGPRVIAAPTLMTRYTISAIDNAGPFAVTLEGGQVREVSLNGSVIPARRIEQHGRNVRITGGGGSIFDITLTPTGGMSWRSRSFDWGID